MIETLSTEQLLQAWRNHAGLEPVVNGCSIERFDSIDIDSVLASRLRQWYLALLDSGDSRLLGPPVSLIGHVTYGSSRLTFDPDVRFVSSVRLSTWYREASVVDPDSAARLISLADNPYSVPGAASPLAWRLSPREIAVTPASPDAVISTVRGYLDPGPDTYILDPTAIPLLSKEFARSA